MRYNTRYKDNNFLTPTIYTQTLSEYVENLKYSALPEKVITRAKLILLSTMGAVFAAKGAPTAEKSCQMALEANGGEGGPATVWGYGKKMSAINAAFAMGAMSDALDWEDCSCTGHPSAGVIPGAWIAAEEKHHSGKDLIAAIVAGYEVYQRIALAVQPSDLQWEDRGWGPASWQIFTALIPACKLYGLDARRTNQAIGMACESSTLPTSFSVRTMSDFKHYEYGYRARDGFLIAKSVEKGIHNNMDGLDDPTCYTGTICGNGGNFSVVEDKNQAIEDAADLTWLTRNLGTEYLILDTLLKPWPADIWSQSSIELVRRLMAEHGIQPDDVAEIVVDPMTADHMHVPANGYASSVQAQFSLPYAIAAAVREPMPGARWYSGAFMQDPEIIAFAQRIKAGPCAPNSDLENFKLFRNRSFPAQKVDILLKNGVQVSGQMDCPPGHPSDMPTLSEAASRFEAQASEASAGGQPDHVRELADKLCDLESVEDIASLSELLS